ncbi:signal peptidase II [Nonomuraea rubra]
MPDTHTGTDTGTVPAAPTAGAARRRAIVAAAALVAAGIDLAAKAAAEARLPHASIDLGLIQLQLAHNSGVAFSVGAALPAAVVIGVTAAITLALAVYAWRAAPAAGRLQRLVGGAVLGGAIANLIDRAGDGVVTDYLHTGWWPTFNLADVFITCGAAALILASLRPQPPRDKS